MELGNHLALGLSVAMSVNNLLLCLAGCLIGTLIGVLPGIGSIATISMLLPLTFGISPVGALIMLAGIYYGAQYGGSTTSILLNVPGEASSIVTAIDGHQMARNGRAGAALAIAAIGSFFAGTVATMAIASVAQPLTKVALAFGPPDYFSLLAVGLIVAAVLTKGSFIKSITMIVLGMLLATIGQDLESGEPRLTFGLPQLMDQVPFVVLAMGAFGLAELLRSIEEPLSREVINAQIGRNWISRAELRQSAGSIVRGTGLGSLLGFLPGNGAVLAPAASYSLEKKLAKTPERFGRGAIEGVAGPESANNAAAQTSFIPLLTLGIPANAVMAMMLGAMTMYGIVPGPQVIERNPDLFWGMIVSMWFGNLMLLLINLPLVGMWVRLLRVPFRLLMPAIILFCCIGIFSLRNEPFDLVLAAIFAVSGYVLLRFGFEPTPLLLGFVLGDMMEEKLRQTLILSRGSLSLFIEEPISATLIALMGIMLVVGGLPLLSRLRARLEE